MMEPNLARFSYSTGVSRNCAGMHPPDGPPVWTALNNLPRGIPPPMSNRIVDRGVPIGTSTKPLLATFPVNAKTAVPLLFSVPMPAYHSAPLAMINGTEPKLFTLLIMVGFPSSPARGGNGGRGRGMPRRLPTDAIHQVFLPPTKAPAPSLTCTLKLKPELRML